MGADTLYYIKDYRRNYYRTNSSDQLIVAVNEREAGLFTLTQANRRIGDRKKASFYCLLPAEEIPEDTLSEELAEEHVSEILPDDRNLSAAIRKQESGQEDIIEGHAQSEDTLTMIREIIYEEAEETVEKNITSYDLSEIDWQEYVTHFAYVIEGIPKYKEELGRQHSDVEKKICDILHYIELCETNDEEAVNLVELLRVCRENRREIKNELHRVEVFQNNVGTNANLIKAKQALKSIGGLETRKYKPRKYSELFENGVFKSKKLEKDDVQAVLPADEIACEVTEEEEAIPMERKYTPFDGRKNNWLQFAKEQAEFYRHARQYAINLQLDIEEIDAEIEEVLSEAEEANCNVAQGYKVFKRLKELRLERKEKAKEMSCVHALTDYIDCEAMADACEDNLVDLREMLDVTEAEEEQEREERAKRSGEHYETGELEQGIV